MRMPQSKAKMKFAQTFDKCDRNILLSRPRLLLLLPLLFVFATFNLYFLKRNHLLCLHWFDIISFSFALLC